MLYGALIMKMIFILCLHLRIFIFITFVIFDMWGRLLGYRERLLSQCYSFYAYSDGYRIFVTLFSIWGSNIRTSKALVKEKQSMSCLR